MNDHQQRAAHGGELRLGAEASPAQRTVGASSAAASERECCVPPPGRLPLRRHTGSLGTTAASPRRGAEGAVRPPAHGANLAAARVRGSRSEAWSIGADRQRAEICALRESLATDPSSPAGTGAYVGRRSGGLGVANACSPQQQSWVVLPVWRLGFGNGVIGVVIDDGAHRDGYA